MKSRSEVPEGRDPTVTISRKAGQDVRLTLSDGRKVVIVPVWTKNQWGEYLTLNITAPRDVRISRGEKDDHDPDQQSVSLQSRP